MLTDVFSNRWCRSDPHGFKSRALFKTDAQLYRDLAQASGGQAIEFTELDFSLATTVIQDLSANSVVRHWTRKWIADWRLYTSTFEHCALLYFSTKLWPNCSHRCVFPYWLRSHSSFCAFLFQVTVFQAVMNPGRPDHFTFIVDASVSNMIIYITGGSSLTFRLTSSTGSVQRYIYGLWHCYCHCFTKTCIPPPCPRIGLLFGSFKVIILSIICCQKNL